MPVYDRYGNVLNVVYNKNGNTLTQAYDKQGNPLITDSTGATLIVMTYNVGQWYTGTTAKVPTSKKADYYAIHDGAFSTYKPDILCLQEALSTWCDDGSLTVDLLSPYFDNMQNSRPTTVYQGHYICTNGYPISNYTVHSFTSHGTNYPSFETAQITVGGKVINIINTHNDTNDTYAQSEVADLVNAVQNMEYFILCGDFNCGAEAVGDTEYNICIKPFADAGYNIGNCNGDYWINTYFATSDPTGTRYKTDNIITSSNITINSLEADTTKLTDSVSDKIDHIPLIAEVTIV